jgi:hypothetical protein
MSYTTIKAIYPGDRTESLEELGNSHGSAPPIWEAMARKYIGVSKAYDYPGVGWMQCLDKIWPLWKRTDIPEEHRLVLMFTYDRAYVAKKDYARMALAIRQFLKDFPPHPGHVNHWNHIAELLESDPDIPAIGLYCTSISEDPFHGPWNEEKEEYDPPDWNEVYDLCGEIDGLGAAPAQTTEGGK